VARPFSWRKTCSTEIQYRQGDTTKKFFRDIYNRLPPLNKLLPLQGRPKQNGCIISMFSGLLALITRTLMVICFLGYFLTLSSTAEWKLHPSIRSSPPVLASRVSAKIGYRCSAYATPCLAPSFWLIITLRQCITPDVSMLVLVVLVFFSDHFLMLLIFVSINRSANYTNLLPLSRILWCQVITIL
jgi:hypothetical protein